jgi:hypothetical protein
MNTDSKTQKSVPVTETQNDYFRFHLPHLHLGPVFGNDHVVSLMIAVGSRAQESFLRTGKLPLAEVFVGNSF